MSNLQKAKTYWNTLKYLKPSQFYYRGKFILKRKFYYKNFDVLKVYKRKINNAIIVENPNGIFSEKNIGKFNFSNEEKLNLFDKIRPILKKEFTFLNETISFTDELGWHDQKISQLWRYNLHYFDYARIVGIAFLACDNKEEIYNIYKNLVQSWIRHNNKIGIGDGWHPYTVSLRIVNWIFSYSLLQREIVKDKVFHQELIQSLFMQTLYLNNNLEHDVKGNHLFENGKSLIVSGLFFKNSKFIKNGESILIKELGEQILKDGGHFERSPMYHCIVLKGLLELLYSYKNIHVNPPDEFYMQANRMLIFLEKILHPDRNIPLFNDAAFGISDLPDYLFSYAGCKDVCGLTPFDRLMMGNYSIYSKELFNDRYVDLFNADDSGYLVSRDKIATIIMDYGKPCPDYLPAHAHADIFSFELSVDKSRLVVDTGTYQYGFGIMRDFNRSTKAHNTVTYMNSDQSHVWGSFRVAERAKVKTLKFKVNSESVYYCGVHDGYVKKFGVQHFRHMIHEKGSLIIILDEIIGKNELIANNIRSYIHLSPESKFYESNGIIELENNKIKFCTIDSQINSIEKGTSDPIQGWYSPEFGKKIPQETIELIPKQAIAQHHVFGYMFVYNNDMSILHTTNGENVEFNLYLGNNHLKSINIPLLGKTYGRKEI